MADAADTCLLDLGNTRYKWLLRSRLDFAEPVKSPYASDEPAESLCRDVLERGDCRNWLVASVRDARFNASLETCFHALGGESLRFVAIPEQPPLALAYADRSSFGIDRYLNLLAAREIWPLPLVVIDAGTAVTVDALDRRGDHLGGLIFPGIELLRRSLGRGTDLIGAAGRPRPATPGDSTEACVSGGVWHGFKGAVREMAAAIQQPLGGRAKMIVTGGDAELVAAALAAQAPIIAPRLLFEGMTRI